MPPFQTRLPRTQKGGSHALTGNKISSVDSADGVNIEDTLIVEAYTPPAPDPYIQDQPKQNSVRFTPTQVLCNYFFHLQCNFFSVRFTSTQLETCLLARTSNLHVHHHFQNLEESLYDPISTHRQCV